MQLEKNCILSSTATFSCFTSINILENLWNLFALNENLYPWQVLNDIYMFHLINNVTIYQENFNECRKTFFINLQHCCHDQCNIYWASWMCQPSLLYDNMYANEYCLQFNAIYFHNFHLMKIDAVCPFADQ